MILHIKNMVCNRCKMVVKDEFLKNGIIPLNIELGEVTLEDSTDQQLIQKISKQIAEYGFEILDDKRGKTIEKIKNLIIELVHQNNNELKVNLSDHLCEIIGIEYGYLTNLFSELEGITIEKYYIAQRVERVKELLVYNELSTSEIAYLMNYSSVAHLSNQFKKVTGLTPSYFKQFRGSNRQSLDDVKKKD